MVPSGQPGKNQISNTPNRANCAKYLGVLFVVQDYLGFLGQWTFGQFYNIHLWYNMTVDKYRSFALTVRPRNGITIPIVDALEKYCKSFPHYQMVLEGENESRHAHLQIWTDIPTTKGDANKKLERVCSRSYEDWDQAQRKVLRQGTKIAYNDFIENYCIQNDLKGESNILLDNRPLDSDQYYPSEEEQEATKRRSQAIDQHMCSLELMFEEWNEVECRPLTIETVGTFLSDMMFCTRKIACVRQGRDRYALCTTLHAYLTKSVNPALFCKEETLSKKDSMIKQQLLANGCSEEEANKIISV